ncbi:MAG TPA: diacylglycerol kinase family lipid kinase [bacterium]|nr:diacylglycerol kinase family lipid kinase [bacterium]HNS49050.1 diacylglycerol kinase family lipid kinase [bacterium]
MPEIFVPENLPIRFILSKAAGGQRAFRLERRISKFLSGTGREFFFYRVEAPGQAASIARRLAAESRGPVVAVGGDGTVNEVINGIYGSGVTLGILPMGSGNGLAASLEIPRRLKAAVRVIAAGRVRRIDLARIKTGDRESYFAATLGMGMDPLIAGQVCSFRTAIRGPWLYFLAGLRAYFLFTSRYRQVRLEGELDGRLLRQTCLLACVANVPQYGAGARIAPAARVDDGRLDLVLLPNAGFRRSFAYSLALFTGRLDRQAGVETQRFRRLLFRELAPDFLQADGDPLKLPLPFSVEVVPAALPVFSG